jgi:hypothetical protein
VVLKRIDTAINMTDHYTKLKVRDTILPPQWLQHGQSTSYIFSPKYSECLRHILSLNRKTQQNKKNIQHEQPKHWHPGNRFFYVYMVLHFSSPLQLCTDTFEWIWIWSLKRGGGYRYYVEV